MTRVFFDMDGVLAEYRYVPLDDMMKQGYFRDLAPQTEAVEALKKLAEDPGLEVWTLSAVIRENPYALEEKKSWLREQLGDSINNVKSVFPFCGIHIGPGLMAAYYIGKPISKGLTTEKALLERLIAEEG